jgi:hypothetical protein
MKNSDYSDEMKITSHNLMKYLEQQLGHMNIYQLEKQIIFFRTLLEIEIDPDGVEPRHFVDSIYYRTLDVLDELIDKNSHKRFDYLSAVIGSHLSCF